MHVYEEKKVTHVNEDILGDYTMKLSIYHTTNSRSQDLNNTITPSNLETSITNHASMYFLDTNASLCI